MVFNNHLNANEYHLFRRWMVLTQEMPSSDHKVVGLSRSENDEFWRTVDRFNRIYYLSVNSFVSLISVIACGLLFISRFEQVGIWMYLCMQTLHVVHTAFTIFLFFHDIGTTNVLFMEVMQIFTRKFRSIARRTVKLNALMAPNVLNTNRAKQFNRRLCRLLYEHNLVHSELFEMNSLFSGFVAANLVFLFL